MDLRICPICEKKGLVPSSTQNVAKKTIVCENEHFIHFKIGTVHFLKKLENKDDYKFHMVS